MESSLGLIDQQSGVDEQQSIQPSQDTNTTQKQRYKKIKTIGKGSFGEAILVRRPDKTQAVIKCINISNLDDNERKDAMQEAKILEVCKHPNIPHFYEVY